MASIQLYTSLSYFVSRICECDVSEASCSLSPPRLLPVSCSPPAPRLLPPVSSPSQLTCSWAPPTGWQEWFLRFVTSQNLPVRNPLFSDSFVYCSVKVLISLLSNKKAQQGHKNMIFPGAGLQDNSGFLLVLFHLFLEQLGPVQPGPVWPENALSGSKRWRRWCCYLGASWLPSSSALCWSSSECPPSTSLGRTAPRPEEYWHTEVNREQQILWGQNEKSN